MANPTSGNSTARTGKATSAGVVLYRQTAAEIEILLVHPGGPLWANKDTHGWSIPKGEYDPNVEDAEAAAVREFEEEIGQPVPGGPRIALKPFRAGRKTIVAWLIEGDLDVSSIASNTFEMEWPPKSGRHQSFPEVDQARWFSLEDAATKLHKGQLPIRALIEAALH